MNGIYSVLIAFVCVNLGVLASNDENRDYLDYMARHTAENHHRQKRQTLVGGGNACSQTFIVPKTAVMCELSPQVQVELDGVKQDFQNHVTELEQLKVVIANLDPDKPRPLPAEVKERLETIIQVRESQAGLQVALERIDANIGHLSGRIDNVEAADRQEVARLIEQQTRLIKVTLHQSNMTLHEEYVDRLTESTRHLTDKLRELQDDLNNKVSYTESKLHETVKAVELEGQQHLDRAKQELLTKSEELEEKLSNEANVRQQYQVQTDGNKGELEKLFELITTVREHQAVYEQDKTALKVIIGQLEEQLSEEKKAKEDLMSNIQMLNNSLTVVNDLYSEVKEELKTCSNKSSVLDDSLESLSQRVSANSHLLPRLLKVADCQDALQFFHPASGVYTINPSFNGQPFDVFCDMEDGMGWTVIQHRSTGETDFYRNWESYKQGFGELNNEHWLGLEKIYEITKTKRYQLKVEILDWSSKIWTAFYDRFNIDGESEQYTLHVSDFHGDAGDSLSYHDGMGFSAQERNNDRNEGVECSRWCHGAWWYRDCFHSNLNGRYYGIGPYQSETGWGDGIVWRTLKKTNFYSVKAVTMTIRPFVEN